MGRYPLRTRVDEYMNATKDYYAPTTQRVRRIVLCAIAREYEGLREENPDLRTDPKDWTEREVVAVITSLRAKELSHTTQVNHLNLVDGLLRFLDNNVMDRLKRTRPHIFPRISTERKGSLSEEDLSKVLEACSCKRGWTGECARFVVGTYAYTGRRAGELIKAKREDLDTDSWTIRVAHPKGERSYGTQRVLPIPDPLKPIVQRFLRAREKCLAQMGLLEATPLVFPRGKPDEYLAYWNLNNWKIAIRKASGVRFTMHTLRRTYGQNLLNRGVELPTVSLMLGHASTLTTEKYYCRKDADSARLEVVRAFQSPVVRRVCETAKLNPRTDYAGYV